MGLPGADRHSDAFPVGIRGARCLESDAVGM